MYTNTASQNAPEPSQPLLHSINDGFSKQNAVYNDLLSGMADKLHAILNKRTPSAGSEKGQIKDIPSDMGQQLLSNLISLENNNNRLQSLLFHLNEIV